MPDRNPDPAAATGDATVHPDGLDARPFHARHYDLPRREGRAALTLGPLVDAEAWRLGEIFAGMNPWAAYGIPASALAAFFARDEVDCSRHAIRCDGVLAGVVVVRQPWLHGPYLQFLGLVPGQQGGGIGAAVLDWMAREAPAGTRNLWLCVSAINTRARVFYERHGFVLAASLDELAADGMGELLMRKRLGASGGGRPSGD